MTIQKNVASQKLHFLMVDATDFATPEPSMTVSAYYIKDGGARSTCSNSVSEITSGLYKITLAATETNAGVATYQFTASGAADQYITMYPEDGYANKISSILADTITLSNATYGLDALETIVSDVLSTLDDNVANKLTSILADTVTLSNATYGLDALETIASDILEAIDSIAAGPLASILVDTNATLDDKLDSILADTKEINSQCDSILDDLDDVGDITVWTESERKQIRSALGVSGDVSALAAYGTNSRLDNATYGLNALETITSQTKSTLDNATFGLDALESLGSQILVDTATISNLGAGSDSAILSTLDGPVGNKLTSILADTNTISNLGAGSDSAILSTLDGPVGNALTSILADTNTISNLGAGSDSAILSTLDGPVGNKLTSILADTNTISNLGAGDDSHILSTLDQYFPSILTDTGTTLDNKIDSILADTKTTLPSTLSNILSTIDHTISALDSTVAGPLASILVDTNATLDDKLDSILADTKEINSQCDSILADVDTLESTIDGPVTVLLQSIVDDTSQILLDTAEISNIAGASDTSGVVSTLNAVNSILADTKTLSNATYGLDALESLASQILVDTATISNLGAGSDSAILSTLDHIVSTVDNATIGLDALETITSDILEAVDSIVAGPLASILVDTNATLDNKLDSILEDTKEINSQCDSILADTTSILVDTTSILVDTGSTIQNDLDELTDAGSLSGVRLALMLDRIYARLFHEVNVTDATGALAIRNAADDGDIATGSITDNDTLTQQTVVTWA